MNRIKSLVNNLISMSPAPVMLIALAIAAIAATNALGQSTPKTAAGRIVHNPTPKASPGCCNPPFVPPNPPPENAAFLVQSVSSGMVLDVPAFSTQPGATIQQWMSNRGANQQWAFHNTTGRGLEISSLNSGLLLDDPASSIQPGTQIQQGTSNLGSNQQWGLFWNSNGSGGFEIQSLSSALVLDVPGFSTQPGVKIQLWTSNLGPTSNGNLVESLTQIPRYRLGARVLHCRK